MAKLEANIEVKLSKIDLEEIVTVAMVKAMASTVKDLVEMVYGYDDFSIDQKVRYTCHKIHNDAEMQRAEIGRIH